MIWKRSAASSARAASVTHRSRVAAACRVVRPARTCSAFRLDGRGHSLQPSALSYKVAQAFGKALGQAGRIDRGAVINTLAPTRRYLREEQAGPVTSPRTCTGRTHSAYSGQNGGLPAPF